MSLDGLPKSVKSLITKDYGDKYLDDADYIAFFWGQIDKKSIDKLFNVVDKALGKSANKLTDKDFKKIDMGNDASSEDEETEEEITIDTDEDGDTEVEDDIEKLNEDDESEDDDKQPESDDESSEDEDDDEEEKEEVDVEVKEIPTSYFFLKITMK